MPKKPAEPETYELSFDLPQEVWRWVRDRCNWAARDKLAYLMLYSRRNTKKAKPDREPWPGIRRLAADMGTNKQAAMDAVRSLEGLGALQIGTHPGKRVNQYTLKPPWEADQTAPRAPRGVHAAGPETVPKTGTVPNLGTNDECTQNGYEDVPKTGTRVYLKQVLKEPIEGANGNSQCIHPEEEASNDVINNLWTTCLHELDLRQDAWMRRTRPVGVDETTISVQAPTDFARDRAEARYGRAAREIIGRLSGGQYDVKFVTQGRRNEREGDRLGGNLDGAR